MFSHGAPCLPGSSLISHLHLTCRFGISQPNGNWERFSDLLGTVRRAYREHAAVRVPVRKSAKVQPTSKPLTVRFISIISDTEQIFDRVEQSSFNERYVGC